MSDLEVECTGWPDQLPAFTDCCMLASFSMCAAVSDLEVEYSEEPGTLYYFKYPVAGGCSF